MISIYLFFLTVKIVSTLLAGYFRFRIARFKNTDTFSNMCFFWGYVLALIAQILGLVNYDSITNILSGYNPLLVIFSQVVAAGMFVLFLTGTVRMYAINKPQQ